MKTYNVLNHYNKFSLAYVWHNRHEPIKYKFINESLFNRYKALKEKTKHNKLQEGSTVWFSYFSEFPLYKFKDYIETNKLNINRSSRYNNTVDTIILNDAIINKYYNPNQTYSQNRGLFYLIDKQFYAKNIQNKVDPPYNVKDYKAELNQDYVIINETFVNNITSKIKLDIEKLPTIEGHVVGDEWGKVKAFDHAEIFEKIIEEYEQGNINIIFDDQINADAGNGMEFDVDLFTTLLDMVASNDEGNVNIAREIIAGMDLEQATPYVLFLFQLYPGLSRQNNTKTWKYVTDYYKTHKNHLQSDYLQLFLHNLGTTYPEYVPIVFECMARYFNKSWKNEIIKEIKIN